LKIEEYLQSLPDEIMRGEDVELGERQLRSIFRLAGLGDGDCFYHLGCGRSGKSLEIAVSEFGAKRAVGIDNNPDKIRDLRGAVGGATAAGLTGRCEVVCADIADVDITDATVILFWFADDVDLIERMALRFEALPEQTRIITVWGPLPGCLPDAVDFPYVMCKTPFRRAGSIGEQLVSVFGTNCVDFVTAWEYAERYTKALGPADVKNDRFLTIIQTLIIWTNAWRIGVACGDDIPEPIDTYVKLMRMNFDIDFGHLLKR